MKNVKTIGTIAMLNIVDIRLFQCFVADRTSDALRSAMRLMTVTTLISDIPILANVLAAADVVLNVLLTVLSIDDNIEFPPLNYTTDLSSILLLRV